VSSLRPLLPRNCHRLTISLEHNEKKATGRGKKSKSKVSSLRPLLLRNCPGLTISLEHYEKWPKTKNVIERGNTHGQE